MLHVKPSSIFRGKASLLKAVCEEPVGRLADPPSAAPVTYSRSITLVLTHDCPWHCGYCGFRSDREGLISEAEIDRLIVAAVEGGAREVLMISGERPGSMPHIAQELHRRGYGDFWEMAKRVAERCRLEGLFPHGNFGRMTEEELRRLRPAFVSMGLMLESVVDEPGMAPEKKAEGRISGLEAAGRAKVPFTSGILVGWGENQATRLRSLKVLADLQATHGHLQEILIQRYVPNEGSRWPAGLAPTREEYQEMILAWREWAPGVAIQIPPNLEPRWESLLPWLDDLGGISWARDEVNPTRPWAKVEHYERACARAGRKLVERLPVYASHTSAEWLDPAWLSVVQEFYQRKEA